MRLETNRIPPSLAGILPKFLRSSENQIFRKDHEGYFPSERRNYIPSSLGGGGGQRDMVNVK